LVADSRDRPTGTEEPLPRRMLLSDRLLLGITTMAVAGVFIAATALLLADASAPVPARKPASAAASIDAYRGLGSWVDMFDTRAWADPESTVNDMADHGVRTLFIETGNSTSKTAIFQPDAQRTFIRAAHARGMKVVAWYLPDMRDVTYDYDRIAQTIVFMTSDGQSFDSFALDIESTKVTPESARNRALDQLTKKIRTLVGRSYPLGAIIPSPVGIAKQAHYWDTLPYTSIARQYDVIVPMGYYTYHGRGASAVASDTAGNVRLLRAQPGCANVPIHLIGGIAEKSNPAEVKAFADAAMGSGCIGASLYGWPGTTAGDWKALQGVSR
jgi:hypothetical protein